MKIGDKIVISQRTPWPKPERWRTLTAKDLYDALNALFEESKGSDYIEECDAEDDLTRATVDGHIDFARFAEALNRVIRGTTDRGQGPDPLSPAPRKPRKSSSP